MLALALQQLHLVSPRNIQHYKLANGVLKRERKKVVRKIRT